MLSSSYRMVTCNMVNFLQNSHNRHPIPHLGGWDLRYICELTHWGWDKMVAILQTTFWMHFLEWKSLYFNSNFTEMCSQQPKCQYAGIGSENGVVPNRQQAIIWTKGALVYMRHLALMSLESELCITASLLCSTQYLVILDQKYTVATGPIAYKVELFLMICKKTPSIVRWQLPFDHYCQRWHMDVNTGSTTLSWIMWRD